MDAARCGEGDDEVQVVCETVHLLDDTDPMTIWISSEEEEEKKEDRDKDEEEQVKGVKGQKDVHPARGQDAEQGDDGDGDGDGGSATQEELVKKRVRHFGSIRAFFKHIFT